MTRLVSGGWIAGRSKGFKTGGIPAAWLVPFLAAFLFGGCANVKITTDYDHAAPFAKYHTYALEPASHGQTLSATSEAALRAALRVNLSARKIAELPAGKPDLAIVRHVFRQSGLSPELYASWGYGPGPVWPFRDGRYTIWAGAPADYANAGAYAGDTLVLDFVDARTRKLVFRGIGKGVIGGGESSAKEIEDAVAQIVAGLPGAPGH
jgi:Domain of unknown function (DUF4136)